MNIMILATASSRIIKQYVSNLENKVDKLFIVVFNEKIRELYIDCCTEVFFIKTENNRVNPFRINKAINDLIKENSISKLICFYSYKNGEGYSNIRLLMSKVKCLNKSIYDNILEEVPLKVTLSDYAYEYYINYQKYILYLISNLIKIFRIILSKNGQPKVILLYNKSLMVGGVEVFVLEWAKKLFEHGFKVHIFCDRINDGVTDDEKKMYGSMLNEYKENGFVPVIRSEKNNLISMIKEINPSTIIVFDYMRFKEISNWNFWRVNNIFKMYNQEVPELTYGIPNRYMAKYYENIYDKYLVISNYVGKTLLKYKVNAKNIQLLYGSTLCYKEEDRKKIQVSKNEKYVVCVSRLSVEKGVDVFIKAINHIKQNLGHVKFLILGDGPERDNLNQLVNSLGLQDIIEFKGFIKDVNYYIGISEFLVLPSHTEGLGLVLLEAIFHGKPVIGSNVGGIPEVILDKYNGLLFEDNNHIELGNKILELLENDCRLKEYGYKSLEIAKDRFDLNKIIKKFISMLK